MGILKIERLLLNRFIKKSYYIGLLIGEYQKIWAKRHLWQKVILSKEQERLIQNNFKKNYDKKYPLYWHRLYQSYTRKFNKDYFPEILFSTKLEPLLNSREISNVLQDKHLIEPLFQSIEGLRIPKTWIGNSYGAFFSGDGKGRKLINFKEACQLLSLTEDVIIKPTVNTSSGKNVRKCKFVDGIDIYSNQTVDEIVNSYNQNFVVQEYVTNCDELSNLYKESLNTIRVITYILDGKLCHVPLALRIGCNGNVVDNGHAGGIAIGISDNGYLNKYSYTEYGETYDRHPNSQVIFDQYYIPNVPKVVEIAYLCHLKIPQLKILSWDFSIDDKGNVVLIEANMYGQSIWPPQLLHGESAFGENNAKMLQLIRKKKKNTNNL